MLHYGLKDEYVPAKQGEEAHASFGFMTLKKPGSALASKSLRGFGCGFMPMSYQYTAVG